MLAARRSQPSSGCQRYVPEICVHRSTGRVRGCTYMGCMRGDRLPEINVWHIVGSGTMYLRSGYQHLGFCLSDIQKL
jgi:hypothetical protein